MSRGWFKPVDLQSDTGKDRTTLRHELNKLYYDGVVERRIKNGKTRLYRSKSESDIVDAIGTDSDY